MIAFSQGGEAKIKSKQFSEFVSRTIVVVVVGGGGGGGGGEANQPSHSAEMSIAEAICTSFITLPWNQYVKKSNLSELRRCMQIIGLP